MHMQATTPIKINLSLHVIGLDANNYHLLNSLTIFRPYGDEITIFPHQSSQISEEFEIIGSFAKKLKYQNKNNNLVIRARDMLRDAGQKKAKICPNINISLKKNLPIASGLGGGSADAALTLFMLNKIWQLDFPYNELEKIAKDLGADVPCCLNNLFYGNDLYMEGIGEILQPIKKLPAFSLLIINNRRALSTAMVFNNLKQKNNPPLEKRESFKDLEDFISYLKQTRNDLYKPAKAIAPDIEDALSHITAEGALFSTMSGSGASCVGIFKDNEAANIACRNIKKAKPKWFCLVC